MAEPATTLGLLASVVFLLLCVILLLLIRVAKVANKHMKINMSGFGVRLNIESTDQPPERKET